MASGFSGGGPDFYRSITNMNTNSNSQSQNPYRTSKFSQIFLDQTSQIAAQQQQQQQQQQQRAVNFAAASSLIGKRTLADFQTHHQHLQQQTALNPALNSLLLRSVKPRMYQHTSPISTLSAIEFSAGNNSNFSPELPPLSSQRYGMPLLHQLRPHPINLGVPGPTMSQALPAGLSYMNSNRAGVAMGGGQVAGQESEKKMMNRLQELEKELLDDNDAEENDAVSVITSSNSEWSETIQSLIGSNSNSNPTAPSPTSSSSSSSSASVTTPVSACSKQTLLDAASAISEGKIDVAAEILTRVQQVPNPRQNSEQRLVDYMSMALKSRVNQVENPPVISELFGKDHSGSIQLLYELSPCFKFGLMAANFAINEATLENQKSNCLHVIDFDIGQGIQYAGLLRTLSERRNGFPAIVKITAMVDNGMVEEKERLRVVRDKLSQLAERLGVSLRFNAVLNFKFNDLTRESLGCESDEVLAVNFAFKLFRMADESVSTENPRDELLRRVKGLAPRVVTLVEQEMNTNTAPFMARVNEVCAYYGALFDSVEASVPRENSDRVKVEEGLGRKLVNSVACEGRDRVERCEVFGKWRARMSMAGFELKPLSQNIAESLKTGLSSASRVNPGFTVKEENGGICVGWLGKTLTVASAWR